MSEETQDLTVSLIAAVNLLEQVLSEKVRNG